MADKQAQRGCAYLVRTGQLGRIAAVLMLAILMPTAVLAGPMRYCVGQNGHQEIEFLHAHGRTHAIAFDAATIVHSYVDVIATLHSSGQHCDDRSLLAQTTTSVGLRSNAQKLDGSSGRSAVSAFVALTRKWTRAHSNQAMTHQRVRDLDPRLVSLRTVVLLN